MVFEFKFVIEVCELMTSIEHEIIIDDVREALNKLRRSYPNLSGTRGFSIFIEACIANMFLGTSGKGKREMELPHF